MKKRYYFYQLRTFDLAYQNEVVRRLEMAVDLAIHDRGYILQFWRDTKLYGVDEAILYVKNGNYGDYSAIQKEWEECKKVFQWDRSGRNLIPSTKSREDE
jgi:hypothetical protein